MPIVLLKKKQNEQKKKNQDLFMQNLLPKSGKKSLLLNYGQGVSYYLKLWRKLLHL